MNDAIAAVGAKSEAELEHNPQRKRLAMEHAARQMRDEALGVAQPVESRSEIKVSTGSEAAGYVAFAVWIVFSAIWIFSTIGVTVQMAVQRRWIAIFPLIPMWGVSFILGMFLYAAIHVLWENISNAFRKRRPATLRTPARHPRRPPPTPRGQ
jgi:hypothetical protein